MDKKEDKKPILNTKEEYVKIPKEFLDILKDKNGDINCINVVTENSIYKFKRVDDE